MAQLKKVVEPFGEVNVHPASAGKVRITATILMEPSREGTQTGIALDGSGSMAPVYGVGQPVGFLASLFGKKKKETTNEITPVAQQLCSYLAGKLDADGGTTCIYWATGPGGSEIEEVGDLTAEQAAGHEFGPPKEFGTGTQLLPAVRYFVDRFKDAPWGFYVFITDGELHDLEEVKQYSTDLARKVVSAKQLARPLKFVLIGVGENINEQQMEELDDLDTGTEVDLWDHKIASEMRVLQEIFAEVVDKNARISDRGRVLDPKGQTVKDYSDTGMSAYLEFEIARDAGYFTLEVNGNRIHQGLTDSANGCRPRKWRNEDGRGGGSGFHPGHRIVYGLSTTFVHSSFLSRNDRYETPPVLRRSCRSSAWPGVPHLPSRHSGWETWPPRESGSTLFQPGLQLAGQAQVFLDHRHRLGGEGACARCPWPSSPRFHTGSGLSRGFPPCS